MCGNIIHPSIAIIFIFHRKHKEKHLHIKDIFNDASKRYFVDLTISEINNNVNINN